MEAAKQRKEDCELLLMYDDEKDMPRKNWLEDLKDYRDEADKIYKFARDVLEQNERLKKLRPRDESEESSEGTFVTESLPINDNDNVLMDGGNKITNLQNIVSRWKRYFLSRKITTVKIGVI